MGLMSRYKASTLYETYNLKDEYARGRICMLFASVASGIAGNLSGGLFYSGFLLQYGFDYSAINILTFIPYITTFLYLLAPSVLERFRRRKYVLAAAKLIVYISTTLGITLLPNFFEKDESGNIIELDLMKYAFVALIIVSNVINTLFSSGYSAWHANFLRENVRASYFFSSSCVTSVIVYGTLFVVSIFTDSAKEAGAEQYLGTLTAIRYAAFAFALIDVVISMLPKEYEYSKTVEKPRLADVFRLPVKNRPFIRTVIIIACVTFAMNIHVGYMDSYILDTVGVPYSLTSGINALYFLFFIIFGPMWNAFIKKQTWVRALAWVLFMDCPTYLLFSFITPSNYVWLYPTVRFSQHIFGVVRNAIVASLPYLNLPDTDTTNYLAFYTIVNNLGAFASRLVGTLIYDGFGDFRVKLFSAEIASVPFLFGLVGILEIGTAVLCFAWFRKATPRNLLDEFDARRGKKAASGEKNT